jgi:hypothetical protein
MLQGYHPPSLDLLPPMVEALSSADRSELYLLSQGAPLETLKAAVTQSVYTFYYTMDEEPFVLGGIQKTSKWPFAVWMVAATPTVARHKKTFLRNTRKEVEIMKNIAQRPLRAHVDERWRKSILWLEWAGFTKVDTFSVRGRTGVVLELPV